MFIAIKTEDGTIKGKISFYCKSLGVSRQAFHNCLKSKDKPWKYQSLAEAMLSICAEDECNDTYGRVRMHQALQLKQPEGIPIPSERTVYRIMEEIGLNHKPKRKPNGITKADTLRRLRRRSTFRWITPPMLALRKPSAARERPKLFPPTKPNSVS